LRFHIILVSWFAAGRWVTLETPVSSTNKTDRHDISEILLKVALNAITLTLNSSVSHHSTNTCIRYEDDVKTQIIQLTNKLKILITKFGDDKVNVLLILIDRKYSRYAYCKNTTGIQFWKPLFMVNILLSYKLHLNYPILIRTPFIVICIIWVSTSLTDEVQISKSPSQPFDQSHAWWCINIVNLVLMIGSMSSVLQPSYLCLRSDRTRWI
jgi:hypothetical protein